MPEKLDERSLAAIAAISPAEEIKPGLPPFLLVQGTADQSVRHAETVAFSERLKQAKVPCELFEMKGASHRISEWPKFAPDYAERTVAWLKATLDAGTGTP